MALVAARPIAREGYDYDGKGQRKGLDPRGSRHLLIKSPRADDAAQSGSRGGGEVDQGSGQTRDSDAEGAAMSDLISTPIVDNDGFNDEIILAEHAEAIRVLGRRVIGDVIEIGRRLTDAKERCGHGKWLPWLKREFGWSEDSALRFMQVAEFAKNRSLRDLEIPVSGLYLLAAPSTPFQK
jgi:Protein of unknown function (DUF3102)